MSIQVAVEEPSLEVVDVLEEGSEEGSSPEQEEQQLHEVLARITERLQALEAQLEQES